MVAGSLVNSYSYCWMAFFNSQNFYRWHSPFLILAWHSPDWNLAWSKLQQFISRFWWWVPFTCLLCAGRSYVSVRSISNSLLRLQLLYPSFWIFFFFALFCFNGTPLRALPLEFQKQKPNSVLCRVNPTGTMRAVHPVLLRVRKVKRAMWRSLLRR